MYEVAKQPDGGRVFGQMTTGILSAVVFVGLGMALFAREVIALLGGSNYAAAADFVGPTLIVCLLQSAVMMMDAGFYFRHRTGAKLVVTLASTIIILVLYTWLIPLMGARGAVLATIGGFGFLFLATLISTQRLFFVRYEWARMGLLLGLAVVLWGVGHGLPVTWWAALVKVSLILVGPVLVWNSGLVRREEKCQVYAQVDRLRLLVRKPALVSRSIKESVVAEEPANDLPQMSYSRTA